MNKTWIPHQTICWFYAGFNTFLYIPIYGWFSSSAQIHKANYDDDDDDDDYDDDDDDDNHCPINHPSVRVTPAISTFPCREHQWMLPGGRSLLETAEVLQVAAVPGANLGQVESQGI